MSSPTQNERRQLCKEEFSRMLKLHGHDVLSYIQRKIHQYHLNGFCDADDILADTYERTIQKVDEGTEINNLVAWTKHVAFRCIQERSRTAKKTIPLEYDVPNIATPSEELNNQNFEILSQALLKLSKEHRQVLYWKVMQGLSWDAVQEQIGGKASVAALRKRKERAIKELRKQFHAIERSQQAKSAAACHQSPLIQGTEHQ